MKVLKKGRKQKGWAKKIKCTGKGNGGGGCGAKLLVEQKDLYKTYHHCYGDSTPDVFVTFGCSECGVETDTELVPTTIYQTLPSKETFRKRKNKK